MKLSFIKNSKKHLQNNNMTYWQHFLFASSHGLSCMKAGILLVCHSILPAIFEHAGSDLVSDLNKSFTDHRNKDK